MDLPMGLGWLYKGAKMVVSAVGKKFLLPHFDRSHRHHRRRTELGAHWHDLLPYLEVSFEMKNVFSNDARPVSKLAIRRRQGVDIPIASVDLTFKAQAYDGWREQQIRFTEITDDRVRTAELDIPTEDIFFTDDGLVPSYREFRVRIDQLSTGGGALLTNQPWQIYRPMHQDLLNPGFVRMWGVNWHLGLYLDAERQMREAIMVALLNVYERFPWARPRPATLWGACRHYLVAFLLKDRVSMVLFWAGIVGRALEVEDSGRLVCKWRWLTIKKVRRWFLVKDESHYEQRIAN